MSSVIARVGEGRVFVSPDGGTTWTPWDGAVSANITGVDGAITDGSSSAIKATVLDLTDANPLTVAIVDTNGDQISSFGGGTQYTEGDTDASITGTAILWEDTSNTLRSVSASKPLPVDPGTVSVTGPLTDTELRASAVVVDGSGSVQPVSDNGGSLTVDGSVTANLGTLNGAATEAKQPALGTAGSASSDVITIQGVTSMTPVVVADGSGSLTVDAPVGTPVFVRLSDGSAAISTLPVSLASVPSHAVTNAGTFAVQAAQSGTWNVGTVSTITNVVHVDDNSGSLTVDGSVTATPPTWSQWSDRGDNSNTAITNTVVTVKGSAGTFGGYFIYNANSSVAYLQVFDVSGSVTLGTTRPDLVFALPAGAAANLEIANGVAFANAIKIAATTTASGSSAPSTALDVGMILYR